ncbi:MAG TPA: ABC transporter substrate-binding protein, partial [Aestuariivirgaceae bacterium]|nr:ABC transporter substrate-binding protein [Aestuariivirgaceae bacterium]
MPDHSILNTAGKRGLSRREFIQTALALGMSVPAASLLWSQTARSQAKQGGHLRLGLAGGATTDSLDPSTYTDSFMVMIGYTVRGNLIEVAADGSAVPEVAESFEGADAAKKWVFKLRQGIEFNTGKTVTVEDVISSIDYHRSEQSTSGAKVLLAAIEEIRADGKDTVIFALKEGNADFPFILADYHLNIMPFADGVPDLQAGAGAYQLKDFQAGVRATLERHPNSYKTAHLDSAEMIGISDTTARQNGLVTGELDLINRPDLKTAHLLAASPGVRVEDAPSRVHYNIPAHAGVEPFTDVDVRLALKFAIDREAIVKTVLFGHGQAGNDQPITPAYRYFAHDLKPRPYDPERAKFHLKKAGHESLTIELSAADAAFAGAVDAASIYSENAAAAGINIKVVRESNDGYWDQVWLKKP